jgi:hypothetical protein
VIDSLIDAMLGEETWWQDRRRPAGTPDPDRPRFIRQNARLWLHRTESFNGRSARFPMIIGSSSGMRSCLRTPAATWHVSSGGLISA